MITLDWETFYSDDYSLSKMTMEEYLRDPRFQCIGLTVQVDDQPGIPFHGSHADIHLFLQQFDWANQAVCSHNAMFDMAILNWKFGIVPKFYVDTMSMARALYGIAMSCSLASLAKFFQLPDKGHQVESAKGLRYEQMSAAFLQEYIGVYCSHDTWLCREIFKRMRPLLPTEEMMAIDWTIACYAQPTLVINQPLAEQALREHMHAKQTALMTLGVTQEALRSDDVMAQMLEQAGVVPPTKFSPKQKNPDGSPKEVWAFAKSDTDFMDLLECGNPQVEALVEARLANKTSIVETRLASFGEIGRRGRLPYPLSYASAQPTLRWQAYQAQKINLQNLPRAKPGQRSPLRDAIQAPPGFKMLVIDLSQIELRVNAWLAGQDSILDVLRMGGDVYSQMASTIFGYEITKVMGKSTHTVQRFVGKTAELGCGYQCGGDKFTYMLRVAARRDGFKLQDETSDFGHACVRAYRATHQGIVSFWGQCQQAIEVMAQGGDMRLGPLNIHQGQIYMPDGMWMYYPNLRWYVDPETGKDGWVYDKKFGRGVAKKWIYGGLLDENLSQRIARCVMRDGILRLRQRYWAAGSVHDEAIALIPDHEPEEQAMDFAIACMTQPPLWALNLPLAAEGGIGRCYGDAK